MIFKKANRRVSLFDMLNDDRIKALASYVGSVVTMWLLKEDGRPRYQGLFEMHYEEDNTLVATLDGQEFDPMAITRIQKCRVGQRIKHLEHRWSPAETS